VDREYFEQYCGQGSYDENYAYHSGIDGCIEICDHFGLDVRSVLVLGAATGRVLEDFEQAWRIRPHGCEISRWAWSRIPAHYRRRIERADMRGYVRRLASRGERFDLIFSNSLVYLKPGEVRAFLALCSPICAHFHFYSSTSEAYAPGDRWRTTLRPRRWWREAFIASGFEPTRSRYLWRSTS